MSDSKYFISPYLKLIILNKKRKQVHTNIKMEIANWMDEMVIIGTNKEVDFMMIKIKNIAAWRKNGNAFYVVPSNTHYLFDVAVKTPENIEKLKKFIKWVKGYRSIKIPVGKSLRKLKTHSIIKNEHFFKTKILPITLVRLKVNSCGIYEINDKILSLCNLRALNLDDNSIKEIPESLGNLQLQSLSLSNNHLNKSKIFWEAFRGPIRTTLEYLNLSKNHLRTIDPVLHCCTSLKVLDLNDNRLVSFPGSLFDSINSLKKLNLSNNSELRVMPGLRSRPKLDYFAYCAPNFTLAEQQRYLIENITKKRAICDPSSLFFLCAETVLYHRLPRERQHVPLTLLRYLDNFVNCYRCNKPTNREALAITRTCIVHFAKDFNSANAFVNTYLVVCTFCRRTPGVMHII